MSALLGPPPGTATEYHRRGSPGSKKRTFSAKVAISLQRGANFQFLDFGTPLEKSISLTFSEQWLCHFSKGAFRWGVPVGRPCEKTPHANFVHGGTVADIHILERFQYFSGEAILLLTAFSLSPTPPLHHCFDLPAVSACMAPSTD